MCYCGSFQCFYGLGVTRQNHGCDIRCCHYGNHNTGASSGTNPKEGTLKRDSKIFEEKLKIYQNFLNSLYKAVKDGKLTDSEKMELQFQTSLVAMHCDPKFIKTISDAVNGVIKALVQTKVMNILRRQH